MLRDIMSAAGLPHCLPIRESCHGELRSFLGGTVRGLYITARLLFAIVEGLTIELLLFLTLITSVSIIPVTIAETWMSSRPRRKRRRLLHRGGLAFGGRGYGGCKFDATLGYPVCVT